MPLRTIGTTPVRVLDPNTSRKRISILMESSNVNSANTGRVFIEHGKQPGTTLTAPNQGQVLMQSDALEEPRPNEKLEEKWRGAVWLTADTAAQTVWVDEELEVGEKA